MRIPQVFTLIHLISYKKYNDKRKFISSVGNTIQKN